jgi:hypothetical protein
VAIGNTTYAGQSIYNSGFGSITTLNGGASATAATAPRTGTIVGRFTF